MEDKTWEQIVEEIESSYRTETVPITVSGRTLRFLQVKGLDELIVKELTTADPDLMELPFWGKIWEASIFMAAYLTAQTVVPGRRILEIGAGMGVSGLFAAACGHEITLSDYDEKILLFARANALLNDLAHVPVVKVDWRDEPAAPLYDWIVGSEVIYHRPTYQSLIAFLDRALKPGGTIFLVKSTSLPASNFFHLLTERFKFKKIERQMRSGDEVYNFTLYAIKRKSE
ncbi:MAG: methyltransferase [Deltaproteobacteria bacterium]|nr:methyltransferase [Deltaproteobacteria bacterium]MBW2071317.1 methyltransferase [Deltaproteobacteria bacterium]